MSNSLGALQTTLKRHHKSVTSSRCLIFEALQGKEPQSINHLIQMCEAQVDRASIYRTISLFEKLGIVQRLPIGWKYKLELSDEFNDHHHHITCSQCGCIVSIPEDTELEARLETIVNQLGFKSQLHQIEVRGLCANCQ